MALKEIGEELTKRGVSLDRLIDMEVELCIDSGWEPLP